MLGIIVLILFIVFFSQILSVVLKVVFYVLIAALVLVFVFGISYTQLLDWVYGAVMLVL